MPRFNKVEERADTGWSDLQLPVMKGYKMACCDCGLVHDIDFEVLAIVSRLPNGTFTTKEMSDDDFQVGFRARRNNRSTGQMRRKPHPFHCRIGKVTLKQDLSPDA